ncbi:TIGR04222 domain-containing membrane protein [Lentzea sp. BCCO 10_0061]|uniref:TIGR04222 domain-containing membrane protein n=1 Tax=Lentzea sokolovensis TaxID=3095429 RepID=A0ABU4V2D3_9PSEU|nr:TIGR04222 domain-containing membrane protein [Lentzea sp. BCCO 10_0061]MDX8145957.1 TIGR04222 domain-containing membrane protein [Lentzea sp. BCCO 10_0061]
MTTHTPEELGCLAGGPARAAEVALARLIQAGLVRVSREGVLSAVHVPGARPATPLEAQILHGLRSGRHLNDVVFGAFSSSEAEGLRGHLINRGLLRRRRSLRPRLYPWLFLLAPLLMVAGVLNAVAPELQREFVPQLPEFPFWYFFAAAAAVFVWASVLRARDPGRLRTRAGYVLLKRAKRRVGPQDPVGAVAVRGLRGRIGGVAVAGMFGLSAVMIATLPGRDTTTSSSCGGGCSSDSGCSSGDSGGGGCGGGCGGGGGD